MGLVRRYALFLALLGSGVGTLSSCTQDPDNEYEPVSDACLRCLSEEKKDGCKNQFDACEGVTSCDDYVVCQLMGRCFERQVNSGCEDELACVEPSDEVDAAADAGQADSPRELAREVESCARSTCADICGFVAE